MSSPSDNASSGRSSPEDGLGALNSGGFARRSSTPAQSFLAPRFWASHPNYQQHQQQPPSTSSNMSDATSSVPRRTSFGTAFSNGGRLSALSALGMSAHNNPALYGYSTNRNSTIQQQQQQHQTQTSSSSSSTSAMPDIQRKRTMSPGAFHQTHSRSNTSDHAVLNSAESTPVPSMPSSPVQKPKRSVCLLPGPDGLCVESRGRRRSEA